MECFDLVHQQINSSSTSSVQEIHLAQDELSLHLNNISQSKLDKMLLKIINNLYYSIVLLNVITDPIVFG